MCGFFFFKQKTAYEMRISDWSSDVCSSDLQRNLPRPVECRARRGAQGSGLGAVRPGRSRRPDQHRQQETAARLRRRRRSEEHTSELQSLMRISYAVFCLKKKKQIKNTKD